jgi:hypothetical protein
MLKPTRSKSRAHVPRRGESAFMTNPPSNAEQTPYKCEQVSNKHQTNTQPTREKNQQPTVSSEITCKKSLIWFTINKSTYQSEPTATTMTPICLVSLAVQFSNPTKQRDAKAI